MPNEIKHYCLKCATVGTGGPDIHMWCGNCGQLMISNVPEPVIEHLRQFEKRIALLEKKLSYGES